MSAGEPAAAAGKSRRKPPPQAPLTRSRKMWELQPKILDMALGTTFIISVPLRPIEELGFEVDEETVLGQGSYGIIYGGKKIGDVKQSYAFKFQYLPDDRDGLQGHVLREADVMTHLNHPTLMRGVAALVITDAVLKEQGAQYGTIEEKPAIVIVYVMPAALTDFQRWALAEQGMELKAEALSPSGDIVKDIQKYVSQLVCAVDFLWTNHIVHGDIKPPNLLLMPGGDAVLGDFGISTVVSFPRKVVDKPQYTVVYRPPEFFQGYDVVRKLKYAGSMDVWAMGVTIFEIVTGVRLFPNAVYKFVSEAEGGADSIMARYYQQKYPRVDPINTLLNQPDQGNDTEHQKQVRKEWKMELRDILKEGSRVNMSFRTSVAFGGSAVNFEKEVARAIDLFERLDNLLAKATSGRLSAVSVIMDYFQFLSLLTPEKTLMEKFTDRPEWTDLIDLLHACLRIQPDDRCKARDLSNFHPFIIGSGIGGGGGYVCETYRVPVSIPEIEPTTEAIRRTLINDILVVMQESQHTKEIRKSQVTAIFALAVSIIDRTLHQLTLEGVSKFKGYGRMALALAEKIENYNVLQRDGRYQSVQIVPRPMVNRDVMVGPDMPFKTPKEAEEAERKLVRMLKFHVNVNNMYTTCSFAYKEDNESKVGRELEQMRRFPQYRGMPEEKLINTLTKKYEKKIPIVQYADLVRDSWFLGALRYRASEDRRKRLALEEGGAGAGGGKQERDHPEDRLKLCNMMSKRLQGLKTTKLPAVDV